MMACVAAVAIAWWIVVETIRAGGPPGYVLVLVSFLFAGAATFIVTKQG
jgi:hypothetical protein